MILGKGGRGKGNDEFRQMVSEKKIVNLSNGLGKNRELYQMISGKKLRSSPKAFGIKKHDMSQTIVKNV